MPRSRQDLDREIKAALGAGRTRPPLRVVTRLVNERLAAAGLPPIHQRAVDRRLKAIYGARWARRPSA